MCILVHAVKRQQDQSVLEHRISNALVEVGPSITLASLAEVLAFAVSAINPMPATRVFAMFAGWFLNISLICNPASFLAALDCVLCSTGGSFGFPSPSDSLCSPYCI
jgi:Niemann-Pick C1 protein